MHELVLRWMNAAGPACPPPPPLDGKGWPEVRLAQHERRRRRDATTKSPHRNATQKRRARKVVKVHSYSTHPHVPPSTHVRHEITHQINSPRERCSRGIVKPIEDSACSHPADRFRPLREGSGGLSSCAANDQQKRKTKPGTDDKQRCNDDCNHDNGKVFVDGRRSAAEQRA